MADNAAGEHESFVDSVKEKISETFHGDDSSSSSDSDGKGKKSLSLSPMKEKVNRLFGKEKSVHEILGGGKPADILLWRNKKSSICVLGVATLIWALFEWIEYHLLSLLCHVLIIVLGIHFLWSNTFNVIYSRCPQFPQVAIHEDTALQIASVLRFEINKSLVVLREIASGKDLKEFLAVIAGLWIVSIAGSCCNLLTLIYICFVLLLTVPLLYERQKDQIDVLIEKAEGELKKQYEVFHAKVLSKVPRGQKEKKFA
ncbi:reticulon-like protein B5 [Cynara cardunculus var. scolymus]|uniref:reticulon-like protein B5 n=1 Tax=Cynara cardunculus var. scolymus TaxID=59895 RepID=UPI000D62CB49|nr:reticulon-like protein B5 [Cynara cardunculus var. scolymus]